MARFKIFPKSGEPFILTFLRFELGDEQKSFTIFNDDNQKSRDSIYLSFKNIAAIILENHQQTSRCFQVHLRSHRDPLAVYADYFEIGDPAVEFYLDAPELNLAALSTPIPEIPTRKKVEGVYVAISEVIAIIAMTL